MVCVHCKFGSNPGSRSGGGQEWDKASRRSLGRGINLGNALEALKEGEWGVKLKAEYFTAIKKAGFATVRLPVRWSAHAGKDAPYTIEPTFAKRVDWAVDQALANELNIIVNVHHYGEMDDAPDENLPRLLGLWQQIATRYKDRPDRVCFELLNEPHGKLTEAKWNAAFPRLLAAVRQTNPTRPVIIGPGQWNSIRALDKLELPKDDRNLILTVHLYDPFEFTHQGAHWVKGSEKWLGRTWTGTDAEKAAITKQLEKAAAWAKAARSARIPWGIRGLSGGGHEIAGPLDPFRGPRGGAARLQLVLLGVLLRIRSLRSESRGMA